MALPEQSDWVSAVKLSVPERGWRLPRPSVHFALWWASCWCRYSPRVYSWFLHQLLLILSSPHISLLNHCRTWPWKERHLSFTAFQSGWGILKTLGYLDFNTEHSDCFMFCAITPGEKKQEKSFCCSSTSVLMSLIRHAHTMDTSELFSTADRGLHGSKRQLGPCLSGTSPRVWTGAVQQLWCVSPAGL